MRVDSLKPRGTKSDVEEVETAATLIGGAWWSFLDERESFARRAKSLKLPDRTKDGGNDCLAQTTIVNRHCKLSRRRTVEYTSIKLAF